MTTTIWQDKLARIKNTGLTFAEIAAHLGVPLTTVSSLAYGKAKSPRFELGTKIDAMAVERVHAGKKKAA
jgi:cyanate lyase